MCSFASIDFYSSFSDLPFGYNSLKYQEVIRWRIQVVALFVFFFTFSKSLNTIFFKV